MTSRCFRGKKLPFPAAPLSASVVICSGGRPGSLLPQGLCTGRSLKLESPGSFASNTRQFLGLMSYLPKLHFYCNSRSSLIISLSPTRLSPTKAEALIELLQPWAPWAHCGAWPRAGAQCLRARGKMNECTVVGGGGRAASECSLW